MDSNKYDSKVQLLLLVLPIINEYPQVALKGGTAINLFVQDMPRLSVDIDLVYLKVEDRAATFRNIEEVLHNIAIKLNAIKNINAKIIDDKEILKILISNDIAQIKLEVNYVTRGVLYDCFNLPLCKAASEKFQFEYSVRIVSLCDLYAGKVCAALSRKHPRDLFDIKLMLENSTVKFDEEFMDAVVVYLASSNKAFYDLLDKKQNYIDFEKAFENNFVGMTNLTVTINDLTQANQILIDKIHASLTDAHKDFILSLANGEPDWSLINIPKINELPGITWKLKNIIKYKNLTPQKHQEDMRKLREEIFK